MRHGIGNGPLPQHRARLARAAEQLGQAGQACALALMATALHSPPEHPFPYTDPELAEEYVSAWEDHARAVTDGTHPTTA